jgi:hypothetical protein
MIGQFRESNSPRSGMTRLPMRGGDHGHHFRPGTAGLIQPLPLWVWIVAFAGALWGGLSIYPALTAACCFSLPIVASLLFIKGESPILFACFAMQWLQVVVLVFYADFYSTPLEKVIEFPELEKATWLSLGGVIALAIGMRTALDSIGRGAVMAAKMEKGLERLSLGRMMTAWLISFLLASSIGAIAWKFGSLRQLATPIGSIKWVFFYLLAYRVLVRDEGYRFLLSAVLLEFVSGFTGFFGSFKEGIMMLIVVVMGLPRGMNLRIRSLALVFITLGGFAAVFWSVIKVDYRAYQVQKWRQKGGASTMDKLELIGMLISRMDAKKMEEGFKATVARVSYVGLFGSVISHVPAVEPHSNGELWLGAITHVLTPRILFPEKKVLDDSARARRFTGMRLSGAEEGTSIGIGYMAESYADFGSWGMFFPIYLLGLFLGRIYRNFCANPQSALLGAAIATSILFSVIQAFAMSNTKIVGSLVVLCLAYVALNAAFGKNLLRWLYQE